MDLPLIIPDWPAPDSIRALCTTRQGGNSLPPFDTFNLALHVGDDSQRVHANRVHLSDRASLPSDPVWLDQQHTDKVLDLDGCDRFADSVVADASWTAQPGRVSAVMTADCIPLLVTNRSGTLAQAVHAGWKGLAKGIVSHSLKALPDEMNNLMVWIGPCIRQAHFEVGQDVYDAFCNPRPLAAEQFQSLPQPGKYLCDLVGILKLELADLGVTEVYDSGLCSFDDETRFYSYRRDGQTGRMASLIWIED